MFKTQSGADKTLGLLMTMVLVPMVFAVGLRLRVLTVILSVIGIMVWVAIGWFIGVLASV